MHKAEGGGRVGLQEEVYMEGEWRIREELAFSISPHFTYSTATVICEDFLPLCLSPSAYLAFSIAPSIKDKNHEKGSRGVIMRGTNKWTSKQESVNGYDQHKTMFFTFLLHSARKCVHYVSIVSKKQSAVASLHCIATFCFTALPNLPLGIIKVSSYSTLLGIHNHKGSVEKSLHSDVLCTCRF